MITMFVLVIDNQNYIYTRKTEVPGKGITDGKYGFGGELLLCHGNV